MTRKHTEYSVSCSWNTHNYCCWAAQCPPECCGGAQGTTGVGPHTLVTTERTSGHGLHLGLASTCHWGFTLRQVLHWHYPQSSAVCHLGKRSWVVEICAVLLIRLLLIWNRSSTTGCRILTQIWATPRKAVLKRLSCFECFCISMVRYRSSLSETQQAGGGRSGIVAVLFWCGAFLWLVSTLWSSTPALSPWGPGGRPPACCVLESRWRDESPGISGAASALFLCWHVAPVNSSITVVSSANVKKCGGMVRCRHRGKTEEDGEGAILIFCSLCFHRCHDWGRDWGWYSTRWEEDSDRLLLSSGQVQAALQRTEVSSSVSAEPFSPESHYSTAGVLECDCDGSEKVSTEWLQQTIENKKNSIQISYQQ